MTLARHATRGNEHESFVQRGLIHTGIENGLGDLNDVFWKRAMPNRILGDKFQQRGILKVIAAFENDALADQIRMFVQVGAQAFGIAGVQKLHGTAKCGVFDSLVVGQIQVVGEGRFFDVPLQARPTRESTLASNGELRVAETELSGEDFSVSGLRVTWVKLSDSLGHFWVPSCMIP